MSNFAGSFYETWVLWTAPLLVESLPPVHLKGVATYQDKNGDARTKITRELEHREMIHGVEEVVEELLNTSSDLTCTTLKTKPAYLYSAAAYRMLAKNLGSDPPLYYNPAVEDQFQNLVAAVNPILIQEAEARRPKPPTPPPTPPPPAKGAKGAPPPEPVPEPEPEPVVTIEWDGSAPTVLNAIERVTNDESKSELLRTYGKFVESAMVPPHPSSMVHLATYKLLKEAIHPLHDMIEKVADDLASTARIEEEARQFARRRKAEDEGMDPDLLEEEPPPPPREPQYDENGEEIPPLPPPKLWESERVFNSAKEVLMRGLYHIQDEIGKLEDAAISVVDTQISIKKGGGDDQQTLWDVFALEREKLFIVLGKEKDLDF